MTDLDPLDSAVPSGRPVLLSLNYQRLTWHPFASAVLSGKFKSSTLDSVLVMMKAAQAALPRAPLAAARGEPLVRKRLPKAVAAVVDVAEQRRQLAEIKASMNGAGPSSSSNTTTTTKVPAAPVKAADKAVQRMKPVQAAAVVALVPAYKDSLQATLAPAAAEVPAAAAKQPERFVNEISWYNQMIGLPKEDVINAVLTDDVQEDQPDQLAG